MTKHGGTASTNIAVKGRTSHVAPHDQTSVASPLKIASSLLKRSCKMGAKVTNQKIMSIEQRSKPQRKILLKIFSTEKSLTNNFFH